VGKKCRFTDSLGPTQSKPQGGEIEGVLILGSEEGRHSGFFPGAKTARELSGSVWVAEKSSQEKG